MPTPTMLSRRSLTTLTLAAAALACVPAAAQECDVKIGVVGPMTGGASPWGLAAKAGTEFHAALANEAGGLQVGPRKCRVKVVSFDSQYTASGGAAAANHFAAEKVFAVVGPLGSPETTGFRTVAQRHGQVYFTGSYMSDVIDPKFPLGFHALQSPITWGPILIQEAKKRFKFSSVMIIAANDQGGTDAGRQFAKMYADVGVKSQEEYFQRGTVNFSPLAARVMMARPEAVELSTVPPADATVLVRALLEAGYQGAIGSLGGTGPAPIIQGAGGIEKLKAFYWLEVFPVDDPGVLKMRADFERMMKMPSPANQTFPVYATAAEQLLRGISLAGTDQDGDRIAAALRKMTPESRYLGPGGWRGKSIYGINQELAFPVGLGMVVDGRKLASQRVAIPAE